MKKITSLFSKHYKVVFGITLLFLIYLAWSNRFVQDDAFISFRYADNFVRGNGLVWNVGEKVEGYTNFLWTVMIGFGLYLGINPVTFSIWLGIVSFIFSLILTYRLAFLIFNSKGIGILTILLLGTNYTFSAFATSGMETQLQTCLFLLCTFILFHSIEKNAWSISTLMILSIALGAAVLTRPDSVLLCVVIYPIVLIFLLREMISAPEKIGKIIAFILPFIVIVGTWTVWRLSYYGDIFPNTYYAKASSITSIKRGGFYLYTFLLSYWLFPFCIFLPIVFKSFLIKSNRKMLILIALVSLWLLYVIRIGGDFIEFRFIVPILPMFFVLVIWFIFFYISQKEIRIAFIFLVLLGSLHHTLRFGKYVSLGYIETVKQLQGHIKYWEDIGRVLGEAFHSQSDVTIATTACGVIPFYSRLRTIDMYGLNDRWVARHGDVISTRPGHQRLAPFSYLLEKKVNLVIGHPLMQSMTDTSKTIFFGIRYKDIKDKSKIPVDSKFIQIPINKDYKVIVYYMTQSPIVDEVIRKNGWTLYPLL